MATKNPPSVPGFFKSIPASIYSPRFYAGIAGQSFWKGFWFFVGFTFLTTLLSAFLIAGLPYLNHREEIKLSAQNLLEVYPAELEIVIQGGKASTNVAEPYYVELEEVMPSEVWGDSLEVEMREEDRPSAQIDLNEYTNMLVIDTKTPFSVEQFESYSTLAWLTEDALYIVSENNQTTVLALNEIGDFVINKAFVDEGLKSIWAAVKAFIPLILVIAFVFAFTCILMVRLIYLLIFALLMLIVSSIMNLGYDYGASYKIGFYALSLSSLVTIVLATFSLNGFAFMGTIISLLVAVINLSQAKTLGFLKEKKSKEA